MALGGTCRPLPLSPSVVPPRTPRLLCLQAPGTALAGPAFPRGLPRNHLPPGPVWVWLGLLPGSGHKSSPRASRLQPHAPRFSSDTGLPAPAGWHSCADPEPGHGLPALRRSKNTLFTGVPTASARPLCLQALPRRGQPSQSPGDRACVFRVTVPLHPHPMLSTLGLHRLSLVYTTL